MKTLADYNRKTIAHIGGQAESWGNRTFDQIAVPDGETPDSWAAKLNLASRFSYPRFSVLDGAVIEENYYSIGD
jgi:hypothetical protein